MKSKTLYLTRDRMGIEPLYYCQVGKKLFHGPDIKSLLKKRGVKKKLNYQAYYQYLAFQTNPSEETFFQGIKKVPPGTTLIFKNGKISFKKYWHLKINSSVRLLSQKGLEKRFKKLLLKSVKKCLASCSHSSLGILLSGGLDSSALVALINQVKPRPVKTFSVGFGQPDDELQYSRLIAKKFKTLHQELIIKPQEIKKALPKIVSHQQEPLADGGAIASFLIAQKLDQKVKTVFIGEGGDELFGGYSWYKLALPCFRFLPEKVLQRIYFFLITFYDPKNCQNVDQFSAFSQVFSSYPGDLLNKMVRFEIKNNFANALCLKTKLIAKAGNLKIDIPFLNHKLVEFCFSLPLTQKISLGQDKILFRQTMADFLPQEILKRRKHGFLLPTRKWFEYGLKKFSQEVLLDKNSHARRLYSKKEIEKFFKPQKFLAEIKRVNLLWRLLIFELWYKTFLSKT